MLIFLYIYIEKWPYNLAVGQLTHYTSSHQWNVKIFFFVFEKKNMIWKTCTATPTTTHIDDDDDDDNELYHMLPITEIIMVFNYKSISHSAIFFFCHSGFIDQDWIVWGTKIMNNGKLKKKYYKIFSTTTTTKPFRNSN